MTTLTLCSDRGQFIVAGPDIEPRKFKSRREPKDWCADPSSRADQGDWCRRCETDGQSPGTEGKMNAFRLRQANHTATLPSLSLMMK
jgi:hypothetical protein